LEEMVMNTMNLFPFLILLSFSTASLEGGWIKSYGGASLDCGFWVEQTSDKGYILTGSLGVGGTHSNLYLIKTDSSGDTLWTRKYGEDVPGNSGWCVRQTDDKGYVVVGTAFLDDYLWLLKTNQNGDTTWSIQYQAEGRQTHGLCVQQTDDHGYIITGSMFPPEPAGTEDLLVLRTDSLGNVIWSRSYGSADGQIGNSLQITNDGNYIVAGTNSKGPWVLKVKSSNGDTLWTKVYLMGNGDVGDVGFSIEETTDRGFIITGVADEGGFFTSGALFLLKTDSLGDSLWAKIYDPTTRWDAGASCHQTPDGGYIVAGTQGYSMQHTGKIWLLKTDSEGDMLWQRTFDGNPDARGDCLALCSDGGYAITGFASVEGSPDVVLIKTDSLGFVGVKEQSSPLPPPPPLWDVASAVGSEIVLMYKYLPQGFALTIYDTSGRKVDEIYPQCSSGELHWGSGHAPGVYIIRERQGAKAKVVLLR
jgi:hypothetical protein